MYNDCDGRCLDGDIFGPGFDSPQVHFFKMPEMLDFQAFFMCARSGCMFQRVKVVCSASCYRLASESLVKVIASEPCSEPPMPLGDRLC